MDAYDMTYNGFCFLKARIFYFFFWIRGNLTLRKAYFVGSGELKSRLSQALIRNIRPDSNSRPAVQISSLLLSCYDF
jgi:hypothetical protein